MFRSKKKQAQHSLWIPTADLVQTPVNAFYERLDAVLAETGFHERVRELCAPYYTESGPGRLGVDPVVYFKMLMVGFYEGITSERAIAARCEDSLSIRHFLRYELTERTPDHSTLSRIRQRLPEEVFEAVFALVLGALNRHRLVRGKRVGLDTSVIEAQASMRALEQRLSGTSYRDYVKQLASAAGVDPEDEAAVRRFDKKRKKRVSNDEWHNPNDPDAKIGRTKHGRTKLIYKPEHVVDLETGVILDAKVLPGDRSDTEQLCNRVLEAEIRLNRALGRAEDHETIQVIAADKGYYDTRELAELHAYGIKTVVPDRIAQRRLDRLSSTERKAVHAARRSVRANYGRALRRKRGELVERSFQHTLDCGAARKATLRGRENLQKRYAIQAACTNLSLLMRKLFGRGTPKQALAARSAADALLLALLMLGRSVRAAMDRTSARLKQWTRIDPVWRMCATAHHRPLLRIA